MPDRWARLWAPHRMEYLKGENRPLSENGVDCPFCRIPTLSDEEGLIVARGESAYVVMNLYPYNAGHLLICANRHVADLTDLTEYRKYSHLFQNADIIFMDAPKDGIFEPKMVEILLKLTPKKDRILVMDDIWFDCMQPLWRSIKCPKIDITSLGHWSGTGIVDLSFSSSL